MPFNNIKTLYIPWFDYSDFGLLFETNIMIFFFKVANLCEIKTPGPAFLRQVPKQKQTPKPDGQLLSKAPIGKRISIIYFIIVELEIK